MEPAERDTGIHKTAYVSLAYSFFPPAPKLKTNYTGLRFSFLNGRSSPWTSITLAGDVQSCFLHPTLIVSTLPSYMQLLSQPPLSVDQHFNLMSRYSGRMPKPTLKTPSHLPIGSKIVCGRELSWPGTRCDTESTWL